MESAGGWGVGGVLLLSLKWKFEATRTALFPVTILEKDVDFFHSKTAEFVLSSQTHNPHMHVRTDPHSLTEGFGPSIISGLQVGGHINM